jgi:hypothetical protein
MEKSNTFAKIYSYKVNIFHIIFLQFFTNPKHYIHKNNNYQLWNFSSFFTFFCPLVKNEVTSKVDDETQALIFLSTLSVVSHHTPPTPIKNNLNFDDRTHMSQLHQFNRSLNSHASKRKRKKLIERIQFMLFLLLSNTIAHLYLYSLRNRANTDVCSSIWRTQKLLDIYIYIYIYLLYPLRYF